jgi:hypothetical protein
MSTQKFHGCFSAVVILVLFSGISGQQVSGSKVLGESARSRLAVNKQTYRLGDLIKLDIGLYFSKGGAVYFPSNFSYRLNLFDKQGRRIRVMPLLVTEERPRFENVSGTLITRSKLLIVGCKSQFVSQFLKRADEAETLDDLTVFENDLFGLPADACIDIETPLALSLRVEVFNTSLFLIDGKPKDFTATGSLSTNPVSLQIIK